MSERYVVIADPPTPNGDLHVGHLAGPYFAADALTRALRLQGHRVAFFSNFDGHQSYVVTAGRRLGMAPERVVTHFRERIAATLAANAIEPDLFGEPDAAQQEMVRRFFRELWENGKLLVKDEPMPWCEGCRQYLFEAYLQGTCPHCGAGCYGNGCESCALPNSPKDMGSPRCRLCGEPPAGLRPYRGLFLPLSRYQEQLGAYLERRHGIYRPHVLDLILPLLDRPLPDIPLSFVSGYGLPVDLPGFPGQVYNVRLEILPGLISTFDKWCALQPDGGWDWRSSEHKVICFHGYENGFQYSATFNTLLLASGLGWPLPYANVTNEFYRLEGKKFSTTRNHAIWGADILSRVACDPLRFYLALTNPETEETSFSLAEFRDQTDRLLTGPWNQLHESFGAALGRRRRPRPLPLPEEVGGELDELAGAMTRAYAPESFSLRAAAGTLAGWLDRLASRGIAGERDLASLLAGLKALAIYAEPVMPRFASRLRESLQPEGPWTWDCFRTPIDPRAVRWDGAPRFEPLAGRI